LKGFSITDGARVVRVTTTDGARVVRVTTRAPEAAD
jgi:hypothetical protein